MIGGLGDQAGNAGISDSIAHYEADHNPIQDLRQIILSRYRSSIRSLVMIVGYKPSDNMKSRSEESMKTAIIWGSTGGIGKALLKELKSQDWVVAGVARDMAGIPPEVDYAYQAQFEDPTSIEQAVYLASMEIESIDLWIYAAGDIQMAKVDEQSPEDLARIMDANLIGPVNVLHFSLPLLADDAHLIFIGAVSERLSLPGLSSYAASKAGLEAFAIALAKEQRKRRVTVVRPGAVETSFWDKVPLKLPSGAASPEKVALKILEAHQSGQKGQLDLV